MIRRNLHEYKGGDEAASTVPSAPPPHAGGDRPSARGTAPSRRVLLRRNLRIIFWPFVIMRDSG